MVFLISITFHHAFIDACAKISLDEMAKSSENGKKIPIPSPQLPAAVRIALGTEEGKKLCCVIYYNLKLLDPNSKLIYQTGVNVWGKWKDDEIAEFNGSTLAATVKAKLSTNHVFLANQQSMQQTPRTHTHGALFIFNFNLFTPFPLNSVLCLGHF